MLPFTVEELNQAVEDGYVSVRPHPTKQLNILNYTNKTQYEPWWNDITVNCRGLVLETETFNIVGRGFAKFWNYTEKPVERWVLGSIPVAFEKLDGSLIICFEYEGEYICATRGSFQSEQADWANRWLSQNVSDFQSPPGVTTLFEVIYRENRIVVDYGDFEGLVLLGAIDNETGYDIPLWEIDWWDGIRAEQHVITSVDDAYRLATGNDFTCQEGLVMVWYRPDRVSFRQKLKHPRYLELHKIITNFSDKSVWQTLMNGGDPLDIIDTVPDEFYEQVKKVADSLTTEYAAIEMVAQSIVDRVSELPNRKEIALEIQNNPYKSIVFKMLDNKDYSEMIWKMLEPKGES